MALKTCLIFVATLLAFVYYWRKKASARKFVGENYQSDENYLRISKIKRIIGGVCIVSLILSTAIPNSPAEEQHQAMLKELAKQRQQDEQKDLDEVRAIFENTHGQSVNLGNLGGKTETRLDKIYFKGKKIYVEAITVLSSNKKGGYRSEDMRDIYVYEKKGGSWVETAVNP